MLLHSLLLLLHCAGNAIEQSRMYGRHFDHNDQLVSKITRESINALKSHFADEMTKDDWRLVSHAVAARAIFPVFGPYRYGLGARNPSTQHKMQRPATCLLSRNLLGSASCCRDNSLCDVVG
jgi:hypothetical protein